MYVPFGKSVDDVTFRLSLRQLFCPRLKKTMEHNLRSGPSFSEVQITGLPEGSTFPILTNDPVIDYFSCLSTFIDHLTP